MQTTHVTFLLRPDLGSSRTLVRCVTGKSTAARPPRPALTDRSLDDVAVASLGALLLSGALCLGGRPVEQTEEEEGYGSAVGHDEEGRGGMAYQLMYQRRRER